jgi:acetyltransferase
MTTLQHNASTDVAVRRPRFPSALIDRIRLADGREVVVRPVLPTDAAGQQQFVRDLSAKSRHERFHAPLRELTPSMLQQLTNVDHVGHVAIVAEALASDDEPTIVAEARYAREGDETHFAIAVADAWQGVGLGRALMQRLLRYAARRGVARLVADVLNGNIAMTRLAASFGGRLSTSPNGPGITRVRLDLALS